MSEKAAIEIVKALEDCVAKQDFEGAFKTVRDNKAAISASLTPEGVRDALKSATKDRLYLSFADSVGFGEIPLDKSLMALEKLLGFRAGSLVLNKAWGLGTVKRLDYFYRRITVDFKGRKGHQFTYAAAVDVLESAPDDHILVLRHADPAAFDTMLKDEPGKFVKAVLKSYGDMPVGRLEDICATNGFVKQTNWKSFWDKARQELRKDKFVEIPVRRADPIRLKASEEDYGDGWLMAFSHETDPKRILAAVREFVSLGKFKESGDESKAKIGERLAFAVTAARKVDDALYARLASTVVELGFGVPPAQEMREYLWEHKRFVKAAVNLPARELGAMVKFLSGDAEKRAKLYASLPDLCFSAVSQIVMDFADDPECRRCVGELMRQPKAPATLTTLIVGKYEQFREWTELPQLIAILTQAIALGEGRQSGETLKMQNIVRRLFADVKWLDKVFAWLEDDADKILFFERFQASIAWDPSTHHTIVVRMTHIAPVLQSHLVKAEKKKEYARITSMRSFAAKKAEYLKLINEDMPANVKRIEFAKSYGDLSENAEYQYAKDEQRALMQKQSLMQADLEVVKADSFDVHAAGEVEPGVSVTVSTPSGEKTYHILGEWDNDVDLGILSCKARLAQNLLGKKVGDTFELPGSGEAVVFGRVEAISDLPGHIRDWMSGSAAAPAAQSTGA